MKGHLKQWVERALASPVPAGIARFISSPRDLILAYHNVVPDGAGGRGDRSLHIEYSLFVEHLEMLGERADFVPLSAIGETASTGRARVSVTFDDAYRGAITLGVDALAARGIPGTVFVTPAFLGHRGFWWDDIAFGSGGYAELSRVRMFALRSLAGRDALIREWATANGVDVGASPEEYQTASESEFMRAARTPGISVAPHSWSHPAMSQLYRPDLADELERPRDWLRRNVPFADILSAVAWPYGFVSDLAKRTAAEFGYHRAYSLAPGPVEYPVDDPLAIRRTTVPAGLSAYGLATRVLGTWVGS